MRRKQNGKKTLTSTPGVWEPLEVVAIESLENAKLEPLPDSSIQLAEGETPARDVFTIEFKTNLQSLTAIYLEAMPDEYSPEGGPGRGFNGNFVLNELEVFVDDQPVKITGANATFSQTGYKVEHAIDGNHGTGWGILPKVNESHHAVFELEGQENAKEGHTVRIAMTQSLGDAHVLGRFRWWATDAPQPVEVNKSLGITIGRSNFKDGKGGKIRGAVG